MNLVPEFDADPVEDDFYGFRDNEIERVEDDIDSNQEVVPPRFKELRSLLGIMNLVPELDADRVEDDFYGFHDNEIERAEDDIDSNEEVVLPRFKEGGKNKRQQTICFPVGFSKFYPDLPDSLFDLPVPPSV